MPLYTYRCECGHMFEDLQRMAERHQAECLHCGKMAKLKIEAPHLDPNMDTPGQVMKFRKAAQRRGRGTDMTSANRDVADESILRHAHEVRAANGEKKIIKT